MFNRKIGSIKLSKYFEIKRAEYTTIQLIPTKSNRNNTTSNIALLINKMFLNLTDIIRIENKKIVITSNMKASYYVHITKEETQFYFIVPTIHLNIFKTKFAATWKNVEMKEVEGLPIDLNQHTKYQLRYKYNDALSLDVDKKNNDLLNSNMSILEVLDRNESVGVLYNFIPTGERAINYFRVLYKDIITRYKNGENLKKNKNIWDLFIMACKFILGIVEDLLSSLSKNTQSRTIGIKKKISPCTERKFDKDICQTQIIVVGKSDSKEKEKNLCKNMCNTFKSISDDNELNYKKIRKDINIKQVQINNVAINNTSVDECNNFIALPGAELINQYKSIKDNKLCAYLSNEESLQSLPLAIMGGSRSGKSTFSINMCKNIIDANEGLIVIDYIKNTELAELVKNITPKEKLIELDLSNPNMVQSLAYNELKIVQGMDYNILQLVNTINTDEKQLSSKMRKYLGAAARVGFCFPDTSMKDIIKILQSHIIRHRYIDNLDARLKKSLDDSIIALEELDDYDKGTKDRAPEICGTKDNKIEGIIDRIDLLRENLVIDSMLAKDPVNNVDFVDAMEQGKVVIIRMRDIDFDDEVSIDILTTFFIQKIWIATKIRGSMHELPRRCTVLIDEVFQSPTSQKLLTKQLVQSAKFGLKFVLTLHYMDQLNKEAQAALKNSNASYMLISGVDKKAYEALEEEFNIHGYSLEDLLNLKQYHSLNLIKTKNGYSAFITHLPEELKENKLQEIA